MSLNLTGFDLTLPAGFPVFFDKNITFEDFISQFQKLTTQILCIKNHTTLNFYASTADFPYAPNQIRFDHKSSRNSNTEYYFVNINNNDIYCFFDYNIAKKYFHNWILIYLLQTNL